MTTISAKTRNCIDISDSQPSYDLNHFVIPSHYKDHLDSVLIPHGVILDRVQKLAWDIAIDSNGPILACCILKGGYQFFMDLVNQLKQCKSPSTGLHLPIQIDFIPVRSYVNTASSGKVTISYTKEEMKKLENKDIVIVEDIIDSGVTMGALLEGLKSCRPARIRVVSLFLKRSPASTGYVPDYVGFEIPDKFIVGYGMDYNEHFRDLDHVCVMNDSGIKAYQV